MQKTLLNLPIKNEICFSDHENVHDERIQQDQLRILRKLDTYLRQYIVSGEHILYVARAQSPFSIAEFFLSGYLMYLMKQCVLVFTDRRVLHIPTNLFLSPKGTLSQILYSDIKKYTAGSTFDQSLTVTYKNGKHDRFGGIRRRDRKKIDAVLQKYGMHGEQSERRQRHHLCPRCTAALQPKHYVCPNCRFEFKSMIQAVKYALVFPGGGLFYTRHRFLGLYFGLCESVMIVFLVIIGLGAFKGSSDLGGIIAMFIVLAIFKLVHIVHVQRFVNDFVPLATLGESKKIA